MNNAEREEGEVWYEEQLDEVHGVNPATDFNYLDEKIDELLGHFRKDFEGCVSAMDLGAKFGDYGSFLSSYRSSPPVLNRPKSPQQRQNFIEQRPSNDLSLKDGIKKEMLSVSVCQSQKPNPCSVNDDLFPICSDASKKSPRTITQLMTSLPLAEEEFISPLHESLLNLPEKDDINLKGGIQGTVQRGRNELSTSHFDKLERRLGKKKVEAADKRDQDSLLKVDTDTENPKGPTKNVAAGSISTSKTCTLPVRNEDTIEDNWVCCDSCEKWRLLPQEWNPDLLPDKWFCSMLSCLPGMNKCSISTEETTKALYASYLPVPEQDAEATKIASENLQVYCKRHDDGTFPAPSGKRKNQSLPKVVNSNDTSHSAQVQPPKSIKRKQPPNSEKMNQQGMVKKRRMDEDNLFSKDSNLAIQPAIPLNSSTSSHSEQVQPPNPVKRNQQGMVKRKKNKVLGFFKVANDEALKQKVSSMLYRSLDHHTESVSNSVNDAGVPSQLAQGFQMQGHVEEQMSFVIRQQKEVMVSKESPPLSVTSSKYSPFP